MVFTAAFTTTLTFILSTVRNKIYFAIVQFGCLIVLHVTNLVNTVTSYSINTNMNQSKVDTDISHGSDSATCTAGVDDGAHYYSINNYNTHNMQTNDHSDSTATTTTATTCTSLKYNNNMMLLCHHTNLNFLIGFTISLFLLLLILFPIVTFAFKPSSQSTSSTKRLRQSCYHNNANNSSSGEYTFIFPTPSPTIPSVAAAHNEPQTSTLHSTIHGSFKNTLNEVASIFEERQLQVRKALEDFSQPFFGFTRGDDDSEEEEKELLDGQKKYDHHNDNHIDVNNYAHQLETITVEGKSLQHEIIQQTTQDQKNEKTYANNNNHHDNDYHNDHIQTHKITHFCFLVHGYRGKPSDLLYVRSAMADTAEKKLSSYHHHHPSESNNTLKTNSSNHNNSNFKHRIVLHSCQSNWNKTSDGVEAGGERIFNEILQVIRSNIDTFTLNTSNNNNNNDKTTSDDDKNNNMIKNEDDIVDVSISLIGNSLGGLYSRYAIAKLVSYSSSQECNTSHHPFSEEQQIIRNQSPSCRTLSSSPDLQNSFIIIDGRIRIHFNVFCTTATPHLGVSGHTWFPLPRSAERGIGSIMGKTGRDIFRMSTLIKSMCTEESYLKPLSSFRKRIAYANGYQTDFVVSTQTAAFLHPESTIPHRMSQRDLVKGEEDDRNTVNKNGMVVATLYTQASEELISTSETNPTIKKIESQEEKTKVKPQSFFLRDDSLNDELLQMSESLDKLGWKKVIVDLRNEMPIKLPVPRHLVKRFSSDISDSQIDEPSSSSDKCSEYKRKPSNILESRDVANAYSTPDDFIAFPLGHNTMVAVEQSRLTYVFKGGRPLMDKLAKEMIDEILSFDIK